MNHALSGGVDNRNAETPSGLNPLSVDQHGVSEKAVRAKVRSAELSWKAVGVEEND